MAVLLARSPRRCTRAVWLWQPWRTLRTPLVWVLHAAYAFIVLHLALRACAEAVDPRLGGHACAHRRAIGTMTMGMMTRTARHTARPLRSDNFDVACYLCVLAAALVRVGVPLVAPQFTVGAAMVSGWLWACGFMLYAIRYAPFLSARASTASRLRLLRAPHRRAA